MLVAATLACAVALSACGIPLAPTAATVNGVRISQSAIDDELTQIRDNPRYLQALGLARDRVVGKGKAGTFDAAFAAQVLTFRVYYSLVTQDLERRHVKVTAADLADARRTVQAQLVPQNQQTGQPEGDAADGAKVLRTFSSDYQRTLVRRQAELDLLTGKLAGVDLSTAGARTFFAKNPEQFQQACARHILVATQAEAAQVKADLSAGTDFAQEAAAKSTDTSSKARGGDLGCAFPDAYVAEFAQALRSLPVGTISDPVQSQFGWHVILVYRRTSVPFAQVSEGIRNQLRQRATPAFNRWLENALPKAHVTVNPKFGRFDRSTTGNQPPHVVPPEAPSGSTSTTAPSGPGASAPPGQ